MPGRVVLADAGYGVSGDFRQALADRGLHYIAGVTDEVVVFTDPPAWDRPAGGPGSGRPGAGRRPTPSCGRARPARSGCGTWPPAPRSGGSWRAGRRAGRFAWVRVWPGFGWKRGECAGADPVWLLIEEQADGELKYALSNLPAGTSRLRAVRLWKSRWPVEKAQADYPSSRRWGGTQANRLSSM